MPTISFVYRKSERLNIQLVVNLTISTAAAAICIRRKNPIYMKSPCYGAVAIKIYKHQIDLKWLHGKWISPKKLVQEKSKQTS